MIGATALLAVEELQASVNSGFVSVSADGFTPYFFIGADSGGPPVSTQFEVPLTFGTLWTSFSNVPATSLLFRGFTFNL
jgi:hypothetical protein